MVESAPLPPSDCPVLRKTVTEPILRNLCLSLINSLQKAAKGLRNPTADCHHRIAWAREAYAGAERALSTLTSLGPLTTFDESVKSPEIGNGKGLTIKVSDWVHKCSRDPRNNRWVTRVDHEDAVAVASAALHDLNHYYNAAPIRYILEMPQGDPREAKVRWVDKEGDTVRLCISVDQLQPIAISERTPGPDDLDERGRCWLRRKYEPDGPNWRLMAPASLFDGALQLYYKEWLPYHTLFGQ